MLFDSPKKQMDPIRPERDYLEEMPLKERGEEERVGLTPVKFWDGRERD